MHFTYEDLKRFGYTYDSATGTAVKVSCLSKQNPGTTLGIVQKAPRRSPRVSASKTPARPPIRVIVEGYSCRPKDPDNLAASIKEHLDALRYEGILPDDSPAWIELVVRSLKVGSRDKERLEITLEIIAERCLAK